MKNSGLQYQILHQKMRTGNSTNLDTYRPLNTLQGSVFLEKGEWKLPSQSAHICSYHFSAPVTVKGSPSAHQRLVLSLGVLDPTSPTFGGPCIYLFLSYIFLFSLQAPFSHLNVLKLLLFKTSLPQIAAFFHSCSPPPTTVLFISFCQSSIFKELSPVGVSMSVPPTSLWNHSNLAPPPRPPPPQKLFSLRSLGFLSWLFCTASSLRLTIANAVFMEHSPQARLCVRSSMGLPSLLKPLFLWLPGHSSPLSSFCLFAHPVSSSLLDEVPQGIILVPLSYFVSQILRPFIYLSVYYKMTFIFISWTTISTWSSLKKFVW